MMMEIIDDKLEKTINRKRCMKEKLLPVVDALLENRGLQEICDAAAKVLENPFWISDLNSRHLTRVSGNSRDENLLSENESGYVQEETLDFLYENHIMEQINSSEEPLIFEAPGTNRRILSCAARITNVTIANVSCFEENRSFTSEDEELIKEIAKIVSAELQKSSFYKDNKDMMYSYFLTDLLENRILYEDMKQRLKKIGYETREYFYLLTVELDSVEHRDILLSNINGQLKHILGNAIYCLYQNHSVFLISRRKPIAKGELVQKRLEAYLANSNLRGALSNVFKNLSYVPYHYRQSKEAVRLGKQSMPKEHLYSYSLLATSHMINMTKGMIFYRDFCNGAIEKLLDFDAKSGSELTESLYRYLENNCSVVKTAAALNLHPNTMRYRLEKIKEVTECRMENGHQCFDLMLALKIYYQAAFT